MVNYSKLPLLTIQAVKELKAELDEQKKRLSAQQSQIEEQQKKTEVQQSQLDRQAAAIEELTLKSKPQTTGKPPRKTTKRSKK